MGNLGTLLASNIRNEPEIATEIKKFIDHFVCIKTRSDSVGDCADVVDDKVLGDMPAWILDACSSTIAFDLGLKLVRDAGKIDLIIFFSPIDIEYRGTKN